MDKLKYILRLKRLQGDCVDTEGAHIDADNILCEILIELGYSDIVKEYEEINKWYA